MLHSIPNVFSGATIAIVTGDPGPIPDLLRVAIVLREHGADMVWLHNSDNDAEEGRLHLVRFGIRVPSVWPNELPPGHMKGCIVIGAGPKATGLHRRIMQYVAKWRERDEPVPVLVYEPVWSGTDGSLTLDPELAKPDRYLTTSAPGAALVRVEREIQAATICRPTENRPVGATR